MRRKPQYECDGDAEGDEEVEAGEGCACRDVAEEAE